MGAARTLQAEQGTLVRVQTQAQSSGSGRSPDLAGPHGSVKHWAYALLLRYCQRGEGGIRRKFLPRHWSGQSPAGTISDHQATQVRSSAGAASMCGSTGTTYMRTGSRPMQHTPARRASHASACASHGTHAVPSDITGQDMWTSYPCQPRAASMDCRPAPDAPECKGGSETAVPEGTTKYTRRCASGQPRRTRNQLSGCAPPAAPHTHTWSMRAPRTYRPHRPPQSDGDPSHHAPPPPPPRGPAR